MITTIYLLDANIIFIAAILSGESKSLRMFYVIIPMTSVTVFFIFFFKLQINLGAYRVCFFHALWYKRLISPATNKNIISDTRSL